MSIGHSFKRIVRHADDFVRPPQSWLADRLVGSQRPDVIEGTNGKDLISGRGGDDTLYGNGGDDLILGGAGSDEIFGGEGSDTVSFRQATVGVTLDLDPDELSIAYVGGADQDRILGVENIVGSKFADSLSLRASVGRIVAGGGDDHVYIDPPTRLFTFAGFRLDGGAGYDILDLGRATAQNLAGLRLGDQITDFEEVRGSIFSDFISGGDRAVAIFGGAGNDNLTNGSVGDQVSRLYGEAGDDRFTSYTVSGEYHGGRGNDVFDLFESDGKPTGHALIDGGDGLDRLDFLTGAVVVTLGSDDAAGTFTTSLGSSGTVIGIEHVNATNYDDRITGNDDANRFIGFLGGDVIDGGGGDDIIDGNFGSSFHGDGDVDISTGGTGADTFVFGGVWDADAPDVIDRITDFDHAEHDRIDLSGIDPNPRARGDQALTFVGTAAFSGTAGELRYEIHNGVTRVMVDDDGDGASDLTIRLDGAISLVATDFLL